MKNFQLFRITGVANVITYDPGLKSTTAEPKRLVAVHVQMNSYAATDDNDVQGYHERAKVFDIPEKMFPSLRNNVQAAVLSDPMSKSVPVDLDIPSGETFKVALKCGASNVDLRGMYEYEIIS